MREFFPFANLDSAVVSLDPETSDLFPSRTILSPRVTFKLPGSGSSTWLGYEESKNVTFNGRVYGVQWITASGVDGIMVEDKGEQVV